MIQSPSGQRLDVPHGASSPPGFSQPIAPDAPPGARVSALSEDVSSAFTEVASFVFRASDASTMRYAQSLVEEFEYKFIHRSEQTMVGYTIEGRALYAHALESLKFQLNNWSMFDRMFAELANELREIRDELQYLSELSGLRRVVEERIAYMSLMKGWPPMSLLIRDYRSLLRETEDRIAALTIRASEESASSRSWFGRLVDRIVAAFD